MCADRIGKEKDATKKTGEFTNFIGCSCCVKINPVELVYRKEFTLILNYLTV